MLFSVTLLGLQQTLSMPCPVTLLDLRPPGSMRCPVAPAGLRPPGSLDRSEGCPFGGVSVVVAFVVLHGGSAGVQLSFGRHRERVAVLAEACLAV